MHGNGASAAVRRRRVINLPDGTTLELEQFSFRDFAQVREEACARYKRGLIKTYTENLDLMPEDMRATAVREAFERAEKVTPDDLPTRLHPMPVRDKDGKVARDPNTGQPILEQVPLEYSNWWMSFTTDGQIYAVWLAAKKCRPELRLEDIDRVFAQAIENLSEATDALGELSEPRLGNAPAEAPAAPP